jgi:hypothetical protein
MNICAKGVDQMSLVQDRSVSGSCEHGNEPSGSMKGGEFLDYMNDYLFLKRTSSPWSQVSSNRERTEAQDVNFLYNMTVGSLRAYIFTFHTVI